MLNKLIKSKSCDEIYAGKKEQRNKVLVCGSTRSVFRYIAFSGSFVPCIDSYSNNSYMAIMGHFLHICNISCEKNSKCHREAE